MLKFILPNFLFHIEKWKWNDEYRVYVSTLGNFKDEHKKPLPIRINSKNGYVMINTACGYKLAHRLVMLTFCPIPNAEDLTVDHKDHNKRYNALENLEWVTKEENISRAEKDLIDIEQQTQQRPAKQDNTNQIKQIYITSGKGANKIEFVSMEDAAKWIITKNNIQEKDINNISDVNDIINKIKNAIESEKLYCNRKWKIIIK